MKFASMKTCIVAAMVIVGSQSRPTLGQQPASNRGGVGRGESRVMREDPYGSGSSDSAFGGYGRGRGVPQSESIRLAAEAVRDAQGDEAKAAAQKKFADLLNKRFNDDMAQRQKELTDVEQRLAKLRELFERRQAKRQEIIELQAKVLLNESEGLGFDDGEPVAGGMGMGSVGAGGYGGGYGGGSGEINADRTPLGEPLKVEAPVTDPSALEPVPPADGQ